MTPQKTPKQKRTFNRVSRHFRTWKPSLRSIGFDADENGQSRQVQRQIPIHLHARPFDKMEVLDGFGSAEPTPIFFFFLAMELPRSVQQLLCHQFNLAPTWKARIIYRDYYRGLMLVFNVFYCDLKYIYEQVSTSLHDAFEWAAKKKLAALDVGL
jgi:hypothetical protein